MSVFWGTSNISHPFRHIVLFGKSMPRYHGLYRIQGEIFQVYYVDECAFATFCIIVMYGSPIGGFRLLECFSMILFSASGSCQAKFRYWRLGSEGYLTTCNYTSSIRDGLDTPYFKSRAAVRATF